MASTFSPLRYPGGKNKTYHYVKYLCKKYDLTTYIEPFAGGAAVALRLLINNDVKRIIINDYDRSIYAFWNTVKNNSNKLIKKIMETPVTMDEWHKQREIQSRKDMIEDELELAFSTFFLNRTNRSGILKAGVIGGKNQNGNYKMDCRFNKEDLINRIKKISKYSDQIIVCNYDVKDFINKKIKQTRKSLTFFDPPYYIKGPNLYSNFFEHEDHVELSKVIKEQMKNRHWILTYDLAEEIKKLYKEYDRVTYCLNYTVASPTNGQEFMFFSKKTNKGNINKYLKIIMND